MDRGNGHLPASSCKEALARQLQAVRADLKQLHIQRNNNRRSNRSAGSLTPDTERLAVAVYVLSEYNSCIAGKLI